MLRKTMGFLAVGLLLLAAGTAPAGVGICIGF